MHRYRRICKESFAVEQNRFARWSQKTLTHPAMLVGPCKIVKAICEE